MLLPFVPFVAYYLLITILANQYAFQTELPPDYIALEKRVDALKQVHQKLLQVTYVRNFTGLEQ